MAFLESRLDTRITHGGTGGPSVPGRMKTYLPAGRLQQNFLASKPIHRYDVSHGVRSRADFQLVLDLFYIVMFTPYSGFRYKDWRDYQASTANSRLTLISGAMYQLQRVHTFGGITFLRDVQKPVSSPAATIYNSGAALTVTTHYTIDYTTGIVTMVSRATRNITAVTVGATTQITLSSANGAAIGNSLYLAGLGGADAAFLNGGTYLITNIAGAVYTLSVNTTGKAITAAGTAAWYYGGTGDALTWAGDFDVPVTFVDDEWTSSLEVSTQNLHVTSAPIKLEEILL